MGSAGEQFPSQTTTAPPFMEGDYPKITQEIAVYANGTPTQTNELKPGALLLTPAPLYCLEREMESISGLGPHFFAINMGIRMSLEDDSRADDLRATLMRFNTPMYAASLEMNKSFIKAWVFFDHSFQDGPMSVDEGVATLLDPQFHAGSIDYARLVASHAAEAAKIVRNQVLPVLPQLEKDLQYYVDDYFKRFILIDERKQSWVPSFLQGPILGNIDATPWDPAQVKGLPQRLFIANSRLRKLPAFLDNWVLHFHRLSELTGQQIHELGYSTREDFERLYKDRVITCSVAEHIHVGWLAAHRAFGYGALKELRK